MGGENTNVTDTMKALNNGLSRVAYPILAGMWITIFSIIFAVCWCVSLIGIPFAYAWIKITYLSFWPFGKKVEKKENNSTIVTVLNVLWLILNFIPLVVLFVLFWAALAFTPGDGDKQLNKVFSYAFWPFGKRIVKE